MRQQVKNEMKNLKTRTGYIDYIDPLNENHKTLTGYIDPLNLNDPIKFVHLHNRTCNLNDLPKSEQPPNSE